jgi:hypothetical protein
MNFRQFSRDFTRISKIALRNRIAPRSLDFLSFHRYAPTSQKPPWKELAARNVVLGMEGGAAGWNSGEPAVLSAGEGVEGD